ncbi:hypothetical protein [Sporanaerobacter acetigenes]|uniref:Uncharacterized protein n=1 Tax=Sporanaerobacter acetigenes DSM 13106 TaxID=1123281 RepID=A0A1M5U2B5_9FIRM|nr:hypothetical protein [Sporanaerobacter acetigenes]SHH57235.1 hypothetical protein SAMN02745180_00507 [Sporanaerobacter acetigenes DSM 13106]
MSKMYRNIKVKCPYCGKDVCMAVDFPRTGSYIAPIVVTCDADEGGCDKDFVVKAELEIKTQTRKIEGEE